MKVPGILKRNFSRVGHLVLYRLRPRKIDPSELYFGQQHAGTMDFFGTNYWNVPINKFPQVDYLKGNKKKYIRYLEKSFAHTRANRDVKKEIERQIQKFEQLIKNYNKNTREPIIYTTRYDGKKIILDGNHRAAYAYVNKLMVPACETPIDQFLQRKVLVNKVDIFGSKKNNMPYQSVYHNGIEVIRGRRRDLADRMKLINPMDIKEKNILDMGCNIGISSFLAIEAGAKKAYGVDISPRITTSAIRLNVAMYGYPCYFYSGSFKDNLKIERCDTGFAFSIDAHVKDNQALIKAFKRYVKSVIYFECHRGQELNPDFTKAFDKIEFVGYSDYLQRKVYKIYLN